ncbi:PPOX class F420-dependent oxidoreductase [Streptomyces sp. NPDC058257]|uniref:PPOX class F420-dependent oxidoreductase n=1 Tax=Streptomyces sp. NPDC058257 TaxID=3346409 RepID=UPI0036EA580B
MTEHLGKVDESSLLDLLQEQRIGTLVTLKRDGRPQLSNVGYAYDPEARLIRLMVTDSRAKTRNLRRDPRASFLVTDGAGFSYMIAEGDAELTPVVTDPHDAVADELALVFQGFQGEHPDWEGFRAAMVRERRLVIRLHVKHVYGAAGKRILAGPGPKGPGGESVGATVGRPGLQLGTGEPPPQFR